MVNSPQPCCEACWFEKEGTFDKQGKLMAILEPTLTGMRTDGGRTLTHCHWCTKPTFAAIYRYCEDGCTYEDRPFHDA